MGYERLSPLDSAFLHLESPRTPMHVGALVLFEGAPFFDAAGRFRIDDVRRLVASRLHLVPRFRRRLQSVPLQQGRPVWVDDEAFDITYHVRLTALPAPGDDEQLRVLMGRVQSQMLDRRRPLWELWFVEGLSGGRVALIQKTHHALIDGVSGVDVAGVLFDVTPEPAALDAPDWQPEHPPSALRLLAESLAARAVQPAELARTVRAAARGPRRALARLGDTLEAAREIGRIGPRLPFNAPVGPHRRFEMVRVGLDTITRIRRAHGVTVNDVVLAAVAGGLRHYLDLRGELVDDVEVRAAVPVSIRGESEHLRLGNRVSTVFAELPVRVADPAGRLAAVAAEMVHLKASGEAAGTQTLLDAAAYLPPAITGLAARLVPFQRTANLVVTNVPGPQVPVYAMGARALEAYPFVGLVDGLALSVAVLSYDGAVGFGLAGDRDAVPDLGVLAEGIDKSVAELAALA